MRDVRPLDVSAFLRTLQEVREALRQEGPISDEPFRRWVQVAQRIRDGWLRVQLIQLLARHRPQDSTWAPVVLGWLLDAAQRKSLWMDQMVYWTLRSWPAVLTQSALTVMCIQLHPRGFAEGLRQALQSGAWRPEAVPESWWTYLARSADRHSAGDRAAVRQVLQAVGRLGDGAPDRPPEGHRRPGKGAAPESAKGPGREVPYAEARTA